MQFRRFSFYPDLPSIRFATQGAASLIPVFFFLFPSSLFPFLKYCFN